MVKIWHPLGSGTNLSDVTMMSRTCDVIDPFIVIQMLLGTGLCVISPLCYKQFQKLFDLGDLDLQTRPKYDGP